MKIDLLKFLHLQQYAIYTRFMKMYGKSNPGNKEPFVLTWDEEKIDRQLDKGIFYCMMNYSNARDAPQAAVHFKLLDDVYEHEDLLLFARDYQWNYGFALNRQNGKIVLLDEETLDHIDIAESEEGFLKALIIYLQYYLFIETEEHVDHLVLKYRDQSIENAGGEVYRKFYDGIFVLKDTEDPEPFVF